jgi:hypothetical protein
MLVLDEAEAMPEAGAVTLSVYGMDPLLLNAHIDRTASQSTIVKDLQNQLTRFGVPYRALDKRIPEAIRIKLDQDLTFEEASIRVFGNADFARRLRRWRNRWGIR